MTNREEKSMAQNITIPLEKYEKLIDIKVQQEVVRKIAGTYTAEDSEKIKWINEVLKDDLDG